MTHPGDVLQKNSVIYRCSDNINNLKIRENLTDDISERVFAWQEKVFSKSEIEFYRDERNCVTDLEKRYHGEVLKLEKDTQYDLFSYINDEDYEIKTEEGYESEKEFDFRKSVISSIKNPKTCKYDFETMFIMADLGEFMNTAWIKEERVLCTIKYDRRNKIIVIYPDFTKFGPYSVKIEGATSRIFHYFIEDASEKMTEEQEIKEKELIRKINKHKSVLLNLKTDFLLPGKNKLQVYLFIEILWARQFEYDNLFVQYFIDLPSDWSCQDPSQLRGITHTSHTKTEEKLGHFGHTFDIILEYDIEKLKNNIPKNPYIYLEIISKDSWSRYRTEGLTYKNLPVGRPGLYQFDLQCFRLIPDTISGQLRRFFIGDCCNYNELTWIGLPKDFEGSYLSKYGTNTVGTGQIGLRINVLQQSHAFLRKYTDNCDDKSGEIFDKLNSSSLVKSVEQVLQAFKRARKNMLAARKNL